MSNNFTEIQYNFCPVCSSPIRKWRVKSSGDNQYIMDLCRTCGFCFVNPRPSFHFLMEFYASFGQGSEDSERKIPDLESVLAQESHDPNSTMDARRMIQTIKSFHNNQTANKFLDVGCGYGFFSKEALDAGFDVVPLELAESERKITHELTGLIPISSSFEEFKVTPESLGVVFMSQILEHALDVNLWIEKSHDLLIKDGIIAIALPNFGSLFRIILQENESFICPPSHLNFFNPNSLLNLLEKHGFKVEAIQWVSRIPKSTFEKRLPRFLKPLLPFIIWTSSTMLKCIDALHLGMMITVYARKVRS